METIIDIGDLPDEQAKLVREFVEFLKAKSKPVVQLTGKNSLKSPDFAAWPLAVRGQVTREEIYDHL